jgi:hypothetical protein
LGHSRVFSVATSLRRLSRMSAAAPVSGKSTLTPDGDGQRSDAATHEASLRVRTHGVQIVRKECSRSACTGFCIANIGIDAARVSAWLPFMYIAVAALCVWSPLRTRRRAVCKAQAAMTIGTTRSTFVWCVSYKWRARPSVRRTTQRHIVAWARVVNARPIPRQGGAVKLRVQGELTAVCSTPHRLRAGLTLVSGTAGGSGCAARSRHYLRCCTRRVPKESTMKVKAKTGFALICGTAAAVMIAGLASLFIFQPAAATAKFAADTGKSCGDCHTDPKGGGALTALGEKFKANGNKLPK